MQLRFGAMRKALFMIFIRERTFTVGVCCTYLSTRRIRSVTSYVLSVFISLSTCFLRLFTRFIVFIFLVSSLLVFCRKNDITAVLKRSDLPKDVKTGLLHLRDRRCKASYNETHVFITLKLAQQKACGTIYEDKDQTQSYTNSLSDGDLFFANFTCSYERKRTVGSLSFLPAKRRLTVSRSKSDCY